MKWGASLYDRLLAIRQDGDSLSRSIVHNVCLLQSVRSLKHLDPDANYLLSTVDHCLCSKQSLNLVTANKQPMTQRLSMPEAIAHCRVGAPVWQWASTDEGINPHVVLVGIGDTPTAEVMAAAHILQAELSELRVRVVNVTNLLILEGHSEHSHGLDTEMFEALLAPDRPVIISFHGYPSVMKQLLFRRTNS